MYPQRTWTAVARCLADAFLAGVWNERALLRRGSAALDQRPRWLLPVVRAVLAAYHRPPADRPRELARYVFTVIEGEGRDGEWEPPPLQRWFVPEPAMGRTRWPVPDIPSLGAMGEFLSLGVGELEWLADVRGLERSVADERLRHYRYTWLPRGGGRPVRVIEQPKPRLKAVQRVLLYEILDRIPAHEHAHGFTRGRSAITHASRHAGRRVVVRLDLEDFFASIEARRIYGIFRTAGYPESVAHSLTALTTNAISWSAWARVPRPVELEQSTAHHRLGRRLATPHLPQGAPTSPALANLAAFGLDRRLAGLARSLSATYSRYADDLTFSGGALLLSRANDVRSIAGTIAREEGFTVNEGKSALMTRAGRQRVCGMVVNAHPNVAREEYDRLKAILHNAALHGPAGQNRAGVGDFRAHLLGRIAWVDSLNPARGAKLRARWDRIDWESPAGG